jgi:hypothetical protein
MKRSASSTAVYFEPKRRTVSPDDPSKAPLEPGRLEFIDRLIKPQLEGYANPFEFLGQRSPQGGYRGNVPIDYRQHTVHLKVSCDHSACNSGGHVVGVVCFPEHLCSQSETPTEAMLFRPYPVSVTFWQRVQSIEVDGYNLFNQGSKFESGSRTNAFMFHARIALAQQCFPRLMRAIDILYTLVLDHISNVSFPYVGMPRYLDNVPMYCPHAVIAHGHRWGNSYDNRLPVFPNTPERDALFWAVFDAACARMQLPATINTARFLYVCIHDAYPGRLRAVDGDSALFARRFPCVHSVEVAYTADLSFVIKIAATFPTVPDLHFGVSQFSRSRLDSHEVATLLSIIRANRRMELCSITFPNPLLVEHNGDRALCDILGNACDSVGLRHSLLLLASADYSLTPRLMPLMNKHDNKTNKPWTAFFCNYLFERQTLGLVRKFLYATDKLSEERLSATQ